MDDCVRVFADTCNCNFSQKFKHLQHINIYFICYDCIVLTLSPGGPGGPSPPEVPWQQQHKNRKKSVLIPSVNIHPLEEELTGKPKWNKC